MRCFILTRKAEKGLLNKMSKEAEVKGRPKLIYVQSKQQFSLLEVIARDEAAEKTEPSLE